MTRLPDPRPLRALEDLAAGRDPQCLEAPLGDTTSACELERMCPACHLAAVIEDLREQLRHAQGDA